MVASTKQLEHLRKLAKSKITTKAYQGSSEHMIWCSLRQRCNNPKQKSYKNYGGRGIKVCERWNDFFAFLADMGKKPEGYVIDRIDNDGDYCPENCRWTDRKTSRINNRQVIMITIGEETLCLADWCVRTGIKYTTAWHRIKRGMEPQKALLANDLRFS